MQRKISKLFLKVFFYPVFFSSLQVSVLKEDIKTLNFYLLVIIMIYKKKKKKLEK